MLAASNETDKVETILCTKKNNQRSIKDITETNFVDTSKCIVLHYKINRNCLIPRVEISIPLFQHGDSKIKCQKTKQKNKF